MKNKLKMDELPDYGDHMTIEDFIQRCQSGSFIDYDGHGNYATKESMFDKIVYPSDVAKPGFKPKPEFTHVIWFNR